MWRSKTTRAAALSLVGALMLSACGGASGPESVQSGTAVTVAWSQTVTNLNPSVEGASAGDLEIDALTHGRFAQVVQGTVQTDPSFGEVSIVSQKPFTVRYDLASPTWSDGIGVDGTDLLLAWVAGSNDKAGFKAGSDDLAASRKLARFDESERVIEITFDTPEPMWQTALPVSVPAHVVGQRAFGVSDPMEAKKLVNEAIVNHDSQALTKLAKQWNAAFAVSALTPSDELRLANGPYQVAEVAKTDAAGQRVVLEVNKHYSGPQMPTYERIVLQQTPDGQRLESLGEANDSVMLLPNADNRIPVRDLERRDYQLSTAGDGTLWMVVIQPSGSLYGRLSGEKFLRALPRDAIISGGAGKWADAYQSTDSFLFDPGSSDYQIALEDGGFVNKLGKPVEEPAAKDDKKPSVISVCLGYDRNSTFAQGAFRAMATNMAEGGWNISDCGAPGLNDLNANKAADAVLIRVPIPNDPRDVAKLWGGETQVSQLIDNKRELILAEYLKATDRYDARDLRVQIEKSIVEQKVAMPIAINANVSLTVPQVSGIKLRSGAIAPLLSGAAEWSPTRG